MRRYDDSDDTGWREPPQQDERRSASGQQAGGQRGRGQRGGRGGGRGGRGGSGQVGGGQRRSVGLMVSGVLAGLVALSLVVGSLVVYGKYREVWDSIKRVDVSGDLSHIKQPPSDPKAINILLIGSDSRAGKNGKIGGEDEGQRSDTVMILHIAPGAHRAVVLSFPRDSVVPEYACTAEKGSPGQAANPGVLEQINATFANGGPGCLYETLDETTHIHINDFVELTFVGFEKVIDDLHGVYVCLPAAVNDSMSGLDLSAGLHHIYGAQALAFWRTREDLGEGSDTQRIQRDQFLMASLLQGIEKSGLLTSTSKMTSVIGDVARSMTTDKELDQTRMLKIAEGMKGLSSKSVQFIEVPTQAYAPNPDWVQWTPGANQLFSAIAHDTKLPKTSKAKPSASAATVDAVSPAKINVEVLNGSGFQGVASEGSADLTGRGFNVIGSGNAPNFAYTKSVVEYGSAADLPAAETVKRELADVEIMKDPSLTPGTIDVILGSTFTALKTPASTGSPTNLTQTFGGITGDTRICHDSSAFSGPDGGL